MGAGRLQVTVRDLGRGARRRANALVGVRASDPMADYLPSTVESLRATVIKHGLLSEAEFSDALDQCRAHLRQPDTAFTMYTVAQVWGRKP